MASETSKKCDATSQQNCTEFTSADRMRFTTLTYEIIEELRMRRELDVDNEKKIQKLLNERFGMGWKLDQGSGKLSSVDEKHEAELRETRRQMEEKMREYQVEATQHLVYRKMAEKEKDSLKDEIRKLQLSNYSLEKKVRESERQEKIQTNEREQHIRQVSRFESQYGQLEGIIKKVTEKQNSLDTDRDVGHERSCQWSGRSEGNDGVHHSTEYILNLRSYARSMFFGNGLGANR